MPDPRVAGFQRFYKIKLKIPNAFFDNMKIAFIVDVFPNLSSDTFILNQITGLLDRGCEVDIYAKTALNPSRLQPDVIKFNLLDRTCYYDVAMPGNMLRRVVKALSLIIRNFHKNPGAILKSLNVFRFGKEAFSLKLLYSIIPFLNKGPYEIIQCHFGPNGDLGVVLKVLGVFNAKVITMFHGYDIRLGLEEGAQIYERLFREGDLFMSICDYNYRKLIGFGLDKEKIVYHPVGIDLDKFPFKWQAGGHTVEGPVKVLTVARLVKVKALDNGIRAIHKVLREHPDLNLEYNIIGDGYLAEELDRLIHDLDLDKVVHLLGPKNQDEVMEAMGKSHIFMLPSMAEALPVALMEAQAVGLPAIATAVGSVNEVIVEGESGYCVPAMDVDAMAERISFLINLPQRWHVMGRTGRRHISEKFNIDKLNDRLVTLYGNLVNECSG